MRLNSLEEQVMNIDQIIEEVRQLPLEERRKLVRRINALNKEPKTRSILELKGLGKELWEGIDAREYVNQLRSEWDHRP
jgi:hypothetical protein